MWNPHFGSCKHVVDGSILRPHPPPQILISFVNLHSFHIFLNCIVIHMLHRLKPKNHPSRGGSFVINKNYPRWWELVRRLPGRRADRKAISGNYQLNTLTGNESIRSVESNSILETQRCSYDWFFQYPPCYSNKDKKAS